MVSAAADRLLLFPSVAQRSFSVASQTINITSRRRRRRRRRHCNAPVAAEGIHAVCVARRRCQDAFTNVGGRRCGNEARQLNAERHCRPATFEMPTARAGAQSHRTDGRCSNRSKRPLDSCRSLAACTAPTAAARRPTSRDSILLH